MALFKKKNRETTNLDVPPPPPMEDVPPGGSFPLPSEFPEPKPDVHEDIKNQTSDDLLNIPPSALPPSDMPPSDMSPEMPPADPTFDIPSNDDFALTKSDFNKDESKEHAATKNHLDELLKPRHNEMELPKIKNMSKEGNVFIEVSKYRSLLSGLNGIKKSLKTSNQEISSLIGDIKEEGTLFNELHKNLLAIEEKLVNLENQLFEEKG